MWIWNPTANNYGVFNSAIGSGTNNVTRYIAPMQGYFVRASSDGNLSLDNSVRVHDNAGNWKQAEINPAMLSLVIQSTIDNSFDETRLLFGYTEKQPGTTKLFSNVAAAPSLYLPSGNEYYTVRYLTDMADYPTVPVMFKPGRDGSYLIKCDFDYDEFRIVILEDRQTNIFQDMKKEQTYGFTASKTDDANRFILHFGQVIPQTENVPPTKIDLQGTNLIYYQGTHLIVDLTSVSLETNVSVYDVLGRIVFQEKLQGGIKHTLNYNAVTQLLIVCLKNADGSLCQKILTK
jgi:hypothetical protein